ncbi:hypothetical protein WG947_13445 [Pontibacter sp. H259]|uniref:hypothetical protein n=1 Tax=Pontibacter sp. H259 TaxID=3133421 RepID=UPI0030C5D630
MRKLLVIGICFILFSGCNSPEKKETEEAQTAAKEIKIVKESIKRHTFSDPTTQDIFIVKLVGDSVQTAAVTFEITDSKGKQLYTDTFEANYLLNYDLKENATATERDAFIHARIDSFFVDVNFKDPAIKPDMTFDPNYSDKKIWDDVQADTSAIGFYYLKGKEDGRWIAYSKAQQKVVLYFNCC